MFALMTLFGIAMFAAVAFTAVALVAVVAKIVLLPLRLVLMPLKLLALPFIAIALLVKFAFLIAFGSVVIALLIPLAILALVIGAPIAILASLFVWIFIWHTSTGYALRVVGKSERAAVYAGISPQRHIVLAMAISGALAGLIGINEIMGVQHRLILNFTGGVGFVGIAVALMGRNHPLGIAISALLFGALYQGGSELSFVMPSIFPVTTHPANRGLRES